jgi:hypothetical protein
MIELRDRTFFINGKRVSTDAAYALMEADPKLRVTTGTPPKDVTGTARELLARRVWSSKEMEVLRGSFRSLSLDELAQRLPLKSKGQIRHQATKLGLTEDRDEWTEHELRALALMRRAKVAFHDVAAILGRNRRACEVKAHQIGATFAADTDSAEGSARGRYAEISSVAKGRVAECLAATQLVLHGLDVFEPFFPQHAVDLIALRGSRTFKLQVKSAVWTAGTSRFRVPILRKNPRSHERRPYADDEVDFFIAVCLGPNAMYVIPRSEVGLKADFNLYPHRQTGGHASGRGTGVGLERYRDAFHLIA